MVAVTESAVRSSSTPNGVVLTLPASLPTRISLPGTITAVADQRTGLD
ncbi:Uncharacterised protein [Serratia fonticola]|uniref:Uncharacterized protein n=1 Tax=Serratia fonticola TaxID=47917 RepID=A0A4U9WJZ8_SERFO|nr:Uncharacterised protein [Serratia fonticola]